MYKLYDQKQRAHGRIPLAGTETMRLHEGLGTATKPSHEPIVVARKPLSESGVARNVLQHSYRSEDGTRYIPGTGAINVDGCRVGLTDYDREEYIPNRVGFKAGINHVQRGSESARIFGGGKSVEHQVIKPAGRWPPNLLLSHHPDCKPTGEVRRVKGAGSHVRHNNIRENVFFGQADRVARTPKGHGDPDGTEPQKVWECVARCPVRLLDEMSGQKPSNGRYGESGNRKPSGMFGMGSERQQTYFDAGGASRFFPRFEGEAPFRYVAKASRRERNAGLEGMPEQKNDWQRDSSGMNQDRPGREGRKPMKGASNFHPTVKPIALMRWLVRLVTPPGGTVLDPFMGSGSTGCAAVQESVNFIGIETSDEYAAIATRRIAHWFGEPSRLAGPKSLNAHGEPRPHQDTLF